jgi:hypothetical protein
MAVHERDVIEAMEYMELWSIIAGAFSYGYYNRRYEALRVARRMGA